MGKHVKIETTKLPLTVIKNCMKMAFKGGKQQKFKKFDDFFDSFMEGNGFIKIM